MNDMRKLMEAVAPLYESNVEYLKELEEEFFQAYDSFYAVVRKLDPGAARELGDKMDSVWELTQRITQDQDMAGLDRSDGYAR